MNSQAREGRVYAFGYSDAAVDMMESRSAERNAGFFTRELTPDMTVLDIGCGPGSITVGLATFVPQGQAIGVDIEPSQITIAQGRATDMGVDNCRFECASVYDLPYDDGSFDAVFGHTILMQFHDLAPVLGEVHRVLKPGGLAGFREIDFGASLYHSPDSALRKVMSTLRRAIAHNDGNPDIGHALPSILSSSGFEVLGASATYACAPTLEAKRGMYAAMRGLWEQADFVGQAESLGWISAEERAGLSARLDEEASDPASLSGSTYVETLVRRPR